MKGRRTEERKREKKEKHRGYSSAGRDLHRHGHCFVLVRGSLWSRHTDTDQRASNRPPDLLSSEYKPGETL